MPVKIRKSGAWVTVSDGADGADGSSTLPVGCIIMFNGTVAPNGWELCDGNGGRPDLRNKFIIGAGNSYNVNDTGTTATGTGGIQYYSLCYIMKS